MSQAKIVAGLKDAGNAAFRGQDYATADIIYSEGLRVLACGGHDCTPQHATLLVNRAAARLKLGDNLGALCDADAALQLDNGRAKALYRKALALQGLQRWTPALEAAEQCLEASTGDGTQQAEAQALLALLQQQAAEAAEGPAGGPPSARLPVTAGCLPPPFSRGNSWEYIPPSDGASENLLLLLHGLGDSPGPFARLARQMQLPQTAALALAGPLEVPFTEGGRSWYTVFDDDLELIQGCPGEDRRMHSLESTLDALQRLLRLLRQRCGWPAHSVHVMGFSQGGTAALELALRQAAGGQPLGSCVAISAALLEERLAPPHSAAYALQQRRHRSQMPAAAAGAAPVLAALAGSASDGRATPVLITLGDKDAVLPRALAERSVQYMRSVPGVGEVALEAVPGKGHAMVQGRAEMQCLMEFWSRHLSRKPTGADMLPGGPGGELIEVRPGEVTIEQVSGESL